MLDIVFLNLVMLGSVGTYSKNYLNLMMTGHTETVTRHSYHCLAPGPVLS